MSVEYLGDKYTSLAQVIIDDTGDHVARVILERSLLANPNGQVLLTIVDEAANEVVFVAEDIGLIIDALKEIDGAL